MSKMRFVLPLMLVLAACWASNVPGDPIFDDIYPQLIQEVPHDYRLPEDVVPTEYRIVLEPFIDTNLPDKNFTFTGSSVISIKVMKKISNITLHARDLVITNSRIEYQEKDKTGKPENKLHILSQIKDVEKDFQIFLLPKPLDPRNVSNVNLILNYDGKINNQQHGFYRSSYLDNENKRR